MSYDALIVGGGLAGSTVASLLAEAGRKVLLLEKTALAHDKMCGEFLSQEALHYLNKSGIDLIALGAVPISRVRIARRGVVAEAALPFRALSLRRRALDEALLARAAKAGCSVRRGVRVQSIAEQGSGHVARLGESENVAAKAIFLATGKHDLLGQSRKGGWHNDLVAFKMYFRLESRASEALRDHIELILFPGGYAGLQPIDSGLANLCLLVTRRQLDRCGGKWEALLGHMCEHSEHLSKRLQCATPMLERPLALSSIPYGFLAATPAPGVWPLGDQAAVIPSFSGDGMSIALHCAHLAAATYLGGGTSAEFVSGIRRHVGTGITLATSISQLLVRLPAAASLTRLSPGLLRRVASATRIPDRALL